MTVTLAHEYSSESTQRELSNEYQHGMVSMILKNRLRPCALDESSLRIGRVKKFLQVHYYIKHDPDYIPLNDQHLVEQNQV